MDTGHFGVDSGSSRGGFRTVVGAKMFRIHSKPTAGEGFQVGCFGKVAVSDIQTAASRRTRRHSNPIPIGPNINESSGGAQFHLK